MICLHSQLQWPDIERCADSWWSCHYHSFLVTQLTDPDASSRGVYRPPEPCHKYEVLYPLFCSPWTFALPGRNDKVAKSSEFSFRFTFSSQKPVCVLCILFLVAYLLGVHGRRTNGVYDHHVGPSMCVYQVATVALLQGVHHAWLIQVLKKYQVLHLVQRWRVCLKLQVTDCSQTQPIHYWQEVLGV